MRPSTSQGTKRPSRDINVALLAAFDPFVSGEAPALRRVLAGALRFAKVDSWRHSRGISQSVGRIGEARGATEIVIDKVALLAGVVADGLASERARSTSSWFVEWMRSEEIDPLSYLTLDGRSSELSMAAFNQGVEIVASRSLIARVLPAACALSRQTVDRPRSDLRHLLFALLDEDPASFGPLQVLLSVDRLPRLRRHLIDRITQHPEEGERIEVWQRLVRPAEVVRTHSDAPAVRDSLGRQAFADVLATRIEDVGARLLSEGGKADSSFILHMDGPWGSGKSSILNFLKEDLQNANPRWLVVEFNAWRNQHRKPAWLPLILDVRSRAIRQITRWSPIVWLVWLWWRIRMDWLSYLLAIALISVAGLLVWSSGPITPVDATQRGLFGISQAAEEALKTLGAIIAAAASFLAMARGFTLGSSRNADLYFESKSEPFRRIIRFFERLVRSTHRPLAVFIDDLDRCDSTYVVDLLEGIQTLLRSAPVVYVVAGDRKWICSSFEKRYADFCGQIDAPGRPLGYLFLDKVFQLSTSVPQLSLQRQTQYWRQLLDRNATGATVHDDERRRFEERAAVKLKGKTGQEDIQREIDRTREGSIERETLLAAAARQTATPEAVRAAEHRLQPLAGLLEANPRSMKRLVNAYGLNQARAFLENRKASVEALARWTIIELRWPLLADYFIDNWPEISGGTLSPTDFPESIGVLLYNAEVRAVIGKPGDAGHLTVETLGPILE